VALPRRIVSQDALEHGLRYSWWLLFPSFTALALRLSADRACADPYDLLPGLTANPGWAWPLAAVYVLAHVWAIGVYLLAVTVADSLLPGLKALAPMRRVGIVRITLMVGTFAVEYCPMSVWRSLGGALSCQG
jgi:hypothetical protein